MPSRDNFSTAGQGIEQRVQSAERYADLLPNERAKLVLGQSFGSKSSRANLFAMPSREDCSTEGQGVESLSGSQSTQRRQSTQRAKCIEHSCCWKLSFLLEQGENSALAKGPASLGSWVLCFWLVGVSFYIRENVYNVYSTVIFVYLPTQRKINSFNS